MADIKIYGRLHNETTDQEIVDSKQVGGGYMPLTTAERLALTSSLKRNGMCVYDTDLEKEFRWNGTQWVEVASGGGGGVEVGPGEASVQQSGTLSEATGDGSSAFGLNTHAGATGSHTEGSLTTTRNDYDEATETGFDAAYSHVEGLNNATNNVAEHGEGKYGWSYYDEAHDPSKSSIHYVGIGTNNQEQYRKNAEVIMNNGDKYILGIGGYDGKNIDDADTLQETIQKAIIPFIILDEEEE